MDIPASNKISVAVLPFKNISSDQEMNFFCDGMTEEIITALAKIKQLKVISRTSSFAFNDRNVSIKEIAKQLEVEIVLEGSIRISGNQMRITIQLVQVEEDSYLWSETWDRKLENLFEIQDEISIAIADKLREHAGHLFISDHLVENQTNNLKAYKHYLKGRYHFNKWNPEDINIAIKEFESAADLDNEMIDAHLGIADSYSFMAVAGFAPRESAWAKAIQALNRAKEIDINNAGLNYMLANEAFFTGADYATSKKLILKSLENAPTHETSHRFLSYLYVLTGEFKKAKKHLFFAKSVDPLNPETSFYEAFYYYRTGDYTLANSITEALLTSNAMNLPALIISIYIKLKEGNWQAAQHQINQSPEEIFTPDERLGLQCLVEITKGKTNFDEFVQLIKNAKDSRAHHAHSYLFICYSLLEKSNEAFEVLQNLFEHKSSILLLSFGNPLCEKIKGEDSYKKYYQRLYPQTKSFEKSKTSTADKIDEQTSQKDVTKLLSYIQSEKPYLNPNLSLRMLAGSIGIHPNQLSWLLNQVIGKNFNEFINQKRISHFKELVVNPENSHISIIGLAYESGFNSKTVFNTAFKKETGLTPKEYQKLNKNV
ncbi:MAG: helix-turn-helix domain-containing protein [Bacteroidota bacterium]